VRPDSKHPDNNNAVTRLLTSRVAWGATEGVKKQVSFALGSGQDTNSKKERKPKSKRHHQDEKTPKE
jgi:hypothetical protein